MSGWTKALREQCADDCAEFGDPPCYDLSRLIGMDPDECQPCSDCLLACGFEPRPVPFDPTAAVGLLI